MIRISDDCTYFYSSLFPNKILAGFATAKAGDGRGSDSIKELIRKYGIETCKLVTPQQTHSSNVAMYVDDKSNLQDTDAVITDKPNVALAVVTADCVPIIYADVKKNLIAVSHQGWMGLCGELPVNVVEDMCMLGSRVDDIVAAIGPAIGECCYDVPEVRAGLYGEDEVATRNNKYYLNLTRASYNQLIAAGLDKGNIDYGLFCTHCDTRFFSYRRSSDKNNFPEQSSFILLR